MKIIEPPFINFAVKISVLHCAYTGLTLQR